MFHKGRQWSRKKEHCAFSAPNHTWLITRSPPCVRQFWELFAVTVWSLYVCYFGLPKGDALQSEWGWQAPSTGKRAKQLQIEAHRVIKWSDGGEGSAIQSVGAACVYQQVSVTPARRQNYRDGKTPPPFSRISRGPMQSTSTCTRGLNFAARSMCRGSVWEGWKSTDDICIRFLGLW